MVMKFVAGENGITREKPTILRLELDMEWLRHELEIAGVVSERSKPLGLMQNKLITISQF